MKVIENTLFVLAVLFGLFIIGPEVETPDLETPLPEIRYDLNELKDWIDSKEATFDNIKPDNASQLIFHDSVPQKTAYSVLYLHGFSASRAEGNPVHLNIAKALKANLYLPRLSDHGLIEEEPMLHFTAQRYLDSAKEALAVAKKIGEKVIVVSSSSGGTLSLILGNDPQIAALLLFGPNVEIYNPNAKLLTLPWGLYISRAVLASKYHVMDKITEQKLNYWTTRYRLECTLHLQKLMETGMRPEIFRRITSAVFMGYYYKNEEDKDEVVSIPAMLKMFDELGTPNNKKQKMAFPDAGDHVIGSYLTTSNYSQVEKVALSFLEEKLNIDLN
ncbi:MAG: alpha/beta hydrolase [Flavobacteriaceae bacterium]|nr:alpha/beta hydrolase [Flavobacteriaceae bacterium]MBL6693140.1 alpha/beta hydrolase [Flavobacteriaceae bacterium]